jgi:hypothetical protein
MSELVCMFCGNKGGWLNRLQIHRVGNDAIFECDWCRLTFEHALKKQQQ